MELVSKSIAWGSPDIILKIEGMMCQKNCASTVQRALNNISNVDNVIVSYSKSSAWCWGKNLDIEELIDAVECVGYDAELALEQISSDEINASSYSSNTSTVTIDNNNNDHVGSILNSTKNRDKSKKKKVTVAEEVINPIFDDNMRTSLLHEVELRVGGMSCASCSKSVKNGASTVYGVQKVDVALLVEKVHVKYYNVSHDILEQIVTNITKRGYSATIVNDRVIDGNGTDGSSTSYKYNLSNLTEDKVTLIRDALLTSRYVISAEFHSNSASLSLGKSSAEVQTLEVVVKSDSERHDIVDKNDSNNSDSNNSSSSNNNSNSNDRSGSSGSDSSNSGDIYIPGPRDIRDEILQLNLDVPIVRIVGNTRVENEQREKEEAKKAFNHLLIALLLGIPVTLLHFATVFNSTIHQVLEAPAVCNGYISAEQFIMFILNTPMQFGVGAHFYRNAFKGAVNGIFGMDFLVATGTSITYIYSIIQVFFVCLEQMPTKHMFFEVSGMLIMFVTIGKYLEGSAKLATGSIIRQLQASQPKTALLIKSWDKDGYSDVHTVNTMNTIDSISSNRSTSSPTNIKKTNSNDNASSSSSSSSGSPLATNKQRSSFHEDIEDISVNLIQKEDVIKILPGAQIPVDGTILRGNSFIDESMITGESVPVRKATGDFVFGGTVNHEGMLCVRVDAEAAAGAIHQIVEMVESAQMSKPPSQDFADKLAEIFTPVILVIALIVFTTWAIVGETGGIPSSWFEEEYGSPLLFAMLFGTSVVVISCPCALGLATPTAVMVGASVGASNGILIKNGQAFEAAHDLYAIVFDKTGTLTEGKPSVADVVQVMSTSKSKNRSNINNHHRIDSNNNDNNHNNNNSSYSENEILGFAAAAESDSEHLIATAIREEASARGLSLPHRHIDTCNNLDNNKDKNSNNNNNNRMNNDDDESKLKEGRIGVMCEIDVGTVRVGAREYLENAGILITGAVDSQMWDLQVQSKTCVLVALNMSVIGIVGIADKVKDEASDTILALHDMGIDVWMVTGDDGTTAHAVADELGLHKDRVIASAMPLEKQSKIQELQSHCKGSVGMIGDGVNDSIALSQADIGLAIGKGTKLAIEAADMVLVTGNLLDAVTAIDLARTVFDKIRLNFFWALCYNGIAIPFAAGVLYPWTHVLIPPQYAGLAMALSSISVVLSSLSLKLYSRPDVVHDPLSGGGSHSAGGVGGGNAGGNSKNRKYESVATFDDEME